MKPRESIYKHFKPAVVPPPRNNNESYWFVFSSNKLLVKYNKEMHEIPRSRTLAELDLSPVRTQYLGTLQEYPCYSAEVLSETVTNLPKGMLFRELRSLYGSLDEDIFLLAGKAIQIVNWDQTHQYCGKCGRKTEDLRGERAKKCPICGFTSYPRLSPAIIVAVFKGNKILLARYAASKGHTHTIIAGFIEPGETIEECLKRELMEEVGIQVKKIRYFGSQPWPFPNSLMIGFTAEYKSGEIFVDRTEIAEADWYDMNNLPELPAKISISRKIIDAYIIKRNSSD